MKRLATLLLLALIVLDPATGFALSGNQRRVIDSGAYYFNVEDTTQACSNDNVALIGSDNLEKIYRFFLNKGLSPEQAAGIAGNAQEESSGDPQAVSASGYRGIFQWDKNIRWPALVSYANNKNADPQTLELQLDFAFKEATDRGNIEGIKEHTQADMAAWYWGRFYEGAIVNGSSSTTPLTNVQHLDRRIGYAEDILAAYGTASPLTGSSGCSGGNGENTRFVNGFTVYSQYDPAWGDLPYGTSTIAESGCGPAAMAMIITNLTNLNVTPVETAEYAGSIGMYTEGIGSSWDIGPRLAQQWGLQYEPVDRSVESITAALREGKLVITPGAGPLPFTEGGHFIVIRGITAEGKFLIGDSGHDETNDQEWDPLHIVNNMRDGGMYAIFK